MVFESRFRSSGSPRAALLALGLEDWIPIPEAVADPEVLENIISEPVVDAISRALSELLQEGEIRLYRGHWDADPQAVSTADGIELLKDLRWYSFHIDDPREERLYFVNVKNIRDES
jgi:hypothetical protein